MQTGKEKMKRNLTEQTLPELEELLASMGEPRFRAAQIYRWIHRGVQRFDEMSDLPRALRERLEKEASVSSLTLLKVLTSARDGTRKFLFGLEGGGSVETVLMAYRHGHSVCISSQAGCRMGCAFCASGILGLRRDLTAGEMLEQVLQAGRSAEKRVSHVVVMGTGEPFDNYDSLSRFLRRLHDPQGLNMSYRSITVSTCGLVPVIARFAGDFPQVNLAVSLHAPEDELRSRILPVNRSYPIGALLEACRDYSRRTGRRVTFEYALIRGINDSPDHADRLLRLLRGSLSHVNLIALNPVRETGMEGTARKEAERFRERLEKGGVPATLRRELGSDIAAACGQLRLGEEAPGSGFA